MSVIIYTDGAAKGNPGNGGYGFELTTNNRMELLSVIIALENLKKEGLEVVIYSDSKYVVDSVEKKWLFGWEKKNFSKKKNPDLWIRFLKSYRKHSVRFVWVKGHDSVKENERCDQLAVSAAESENLKKDVWYENNIANKNELF